MSISVAVLGATGVVGQKVIALLSRDSRFSIAELIASDQHVGRAFGDVCNWREPLVPLPANISNMAIVNAQNLRSDFVISCLPSEVAETIEMALVEQGKIIFSNASAFRMHQNVPLLVPEINSSHLSLLKEQNHKGKIITNPNCSAVGATLALAPLMDLSDIEHISIVTLQSVSGGGYPGVSSLDILGNTIPHIDDEIAKITRETKKILGLPNKPAGFPVTVQVHRVPVMYGHTITIHVMFKNRVNPNDAVEVYDAWNKKYPELFLLHAKNGHPQASKDLRHDDMRVHIGHLQQGDKPTILSLVSLTNNIVRGAAGATIVNMEAYLNFRGREF